MTNQPIDPDSSPGAGGAGGVPAELAMMRRRVHELCETMWAARDRGEVMDTVVEIESLKSTLDALELGVVRELEATGAVKEVGWASTADFVTAVAGGHKGCGPAMVQLAKAVDEPVLSPVGQALCDGWLSTAKAQVIDRGVDDCPATPNYQQRGSQRCWPRPKPSMPPTSGRSPGTCWSGSTPRVSVTISLEDLQRQCGLFGSTETGEDLTATTIRRLCCDADVIPVVLGTRGEVLDVGRQQRLVTTAIWKALVARDHHCRFLNCTRSPVMTHAHHIQHWAAGGPTSLDNMILLCGQHHRLIHAGPWDIRRAGPAAFEFDPPSGMRRRSSRPPSDG